MRKQIKRRKKQENNEFFAAVFWLVLCVGIIAAWGAGRIALDKKIDETVQKKEEIMQSCREHKQSIAILENRVEKAKGSEVLMEKVESFKLPLRPHVYGQFVTIAADETIKIDGETEASYVFRQ